MINTIPFSKYEAVGNNFVLVNAATVGDYDWSLLATKMCSQGFGVGSDGLLVIEYTSIADFKVRMFNSDGTEDACGNGLRCVAAFSRLECAGSKSRLNIEAIDGIHQAEILGVEGSVVTARTGLGIPSLRREDIPAKVDVPELINYPLELDGQTFTITCVSVGTPHAVIFVPGDELTDCVPDIAEKIGNHPIFPDRVSVNWCSVDAPNAIRIRTWERGVGCTLGCATGASSALVAANLNDLTGEAATVSSLGGDLTIEWLNRGQLFVTGAARLVYKGEWLLDL